MAKKIDFNALLEKGKELALAKGEKVGLGVCGVLALLFVAMGVLRGVSPEKPKSGKSWDQELKDKTQELSKVNKTDFAPNEMPVAPPPTPKDVKDIEWGPFAFAGVETAPLFSLPERGDRKRENPFVLKPLDDAKHVHVQYVRSGVLAYSINPITRTANVFGDLPKGAKGFGEGGGGVGAPTASAGQVAKDVLPRRMVVVSMVFPWKAQLEEYRKALRLAHLADLINSPDLPRPVGLNVMRADMSPEVKEVKWQPLYLYDKDEKTVRVAPGIQNLLNAALVDDSNVKQLGQYLKPGLATPLPLLANYTYLYPVPSYYPTVKLEGIEVEELEKPNPNIKGKEPVNQPNPNFKFPFPKKENPMSEADAGRLPREQPFKLLSKDLQQKFTGMYNIFHPLGLAAEAVDKSGQPGMQQPPFHQPILGEKFGKKDEKGDFKVVVHDAVLRFLDTDVEPGKTYAYIVQVRMANPNHGRTKDLAFQELAKQEELLSPFTEPHAVRIKIPDEYFVYTTDVEFDQKLGVKLPKGADWGPAIPLSKPSDIHHLAPIQVHRWLTLANGQQIADWAIAERLLVRRGEFLGKDGVHVEVPAWRQDKEQFDLAHAPGVIGKKPDPKSPATGVPVDFLRSPKAVLVDFAGGQKQVKIGTANPSKDESAYELLVLSEDGTLSVRNSRDDTENEERTKRYNAWRERVLRLKGFQVGAGGIIMPGAGGK